MSKVREERRTANPEPVIQTTLTRQKGMIRMEKYLETMFGFQRFNENDRLQRVIDSVHARYNTADGKSGMRELNLDEMEWVAAAGVQQPKQGLEKKKYEPS